MEILYLLVPLAVLLAGVIVWAFLWSIRTGQFDDLEGPAYQILMDPDEPLSPAPHDKPGPAKPPADHRKTLPNHDRNR